MDSARILLIRAGVIILALLVVAFLMVVSKAILLEGFVGGAIRYGRALRCFFLRGIFRCNSVKMCHAIPNYY